MRFVADRPGHDFRYAIDPTKLVTELGWKPDEDFDSGIVKTVDWYLRRKQTDISRSGRMRVHPF